MLDYKLVEAFAAVVGCGGFEKAAQSLHLTQSAVSQRVKLLEEQSGRILLVRASPPRPTPAGRDMLRHYRQVKRLEDDLASTIGPGSSGFTVLPVGVNADSLVTWFLPAVQDFLEAESVLLDLSVDDQDETHKLLRGGEVLGCVSARPEPFQGCRVEFLGVMDYRLCGTPAYATRWFPNGFTREAAAHAPIMLYNRKDELHVKLFEQAFGETVSGHPTAYVPSSGKFPDFVLTGQVSGMLPDEDCLEHIRAGRMVNLVGDMVLPIPLYWHSWGLDSALLKGFSAALARGARSRLRQS